MTTAAELTARRQVMDAAAQRRALVAAATKRHPPRQAPPAQLPRPTAYTRALTDIADDLNAEVLSALADAGLPTPHHDAADGDAGGMPSFNRADLWARLRRIADAVVKRRGSFLDRALDAVAANVANVSRAQWAKQAKAIVGIDLSQVEPNLTPTINSFRRANVELITTMARDKVERVKALLDEHAGSRVETIRDRILEEGNVTRRQAALIARDQVLSLNAQVTEKRHTAAGITKYTWRTSGDGDVRPAHRALDGEVFAYADPPVVDAKRGRRENPGQDYQCRCSAEPVIEWGEEDSAARADAGDFKEGEHPREKGGEFTSGGSGSASATPAAATDPPKNPSAPSPIKAASFKRLDPTKMSAALALSPATGAVPTQPSVADQHTIREQGREILGDIGLPKVPTHPALGRTPGEFDAYEVRPAASMGSTLGMLTKDGRMVVSDVHHQGIAEYIERIGKKTTALATPDQENAMATYIHETLHEHSNVAAGAYRGVGRDIEESMTELAARRAMRDNYGATSAWVQHPAGGAPVAGRPYDVHIACVRGLVHASIEKLAAQRKLLPAPTLADVGGYLDNAAIAYKKHVATQGTARTKDDVVDNLLTVLKARLPPGLNDGMAVGMIRGALVTYAPPRPSGQTP